MVFECTPVQYLTISIKDFEYYRYQLYSIEPYVVICFNDLRKFYASLGDIMVSSPSHYFFFSFVSQGLRYYIRRSAEPERLYSYIF